MFSYSSDFHAMSTGLSRASLTDCSTESPDAFKQLPERTTFRDDSGNSSNSSSLEHLPHNTPASPQSQDPQPLLQQDVVMPLMHGHRDLFDDRMWQSAGVLLELGGYDTDNPHVPLHKTVCCALCRKKQERQMKLKPDSPGRNVTSSSCHHQDTALISDSNNNSSLVELNRSMNSQHDEVDRVQLSAPFPVDNLPAAAAAEVADVLRDSGDGFGKSVNEDSCMTAVTDRQNVSRVDDVCSSSVTPLTGTRPALRRSRGLDVDTTRESFRRKPRTTITDDVQGKQITDPVLLQALQTSPYAKHLNLLSAQDEKLLSKLAARKQLEQEQQIQRERIKQQWANDTKQQQLRKQQQQQLAANRRSGDFSQPIHNRKSTADFRRSLTTENGTNSTVNHQTSPSEIRNSFRNTNRSFQRSASARVCQHLDTNCDCGRDHNRQVLVESTGNKSKRHSQHNHTEHSDSSVTECSCQRCVANEPLERKPRDADNTHLIQAMERKAHVEHCLEEQRRETENYIRELQEKQDEDTRRVNMFRQDKQAQAAERAKQKEKHVRLTVEMAREIQRHEQDELANMHDSWEESLSAAELKAKKRREEESAIIRAELQMKIERSRQKQAYMENELKKWQEEMIAYRELQEKHALAVAQAHIDRRRETASKDRELREKQQRDNLLRMQEQEREWKASVEATIKSKEARSEMLLREKAAAKKQAQEMARLSRQMRDELRLNSSLTDFERFV